MSTTRRILFSTLLLASVTASAAAFAQGSRVRPEVYFPQAADFPADAPCYIAFVHGSGSHFGRKDGYKDADFEAPDDPVINMIGNMETSWNPDAREAKTNRSLTYHASRRYGQDLGWGSGCATVRIGYNGYQPWYHEEAAGRVASRLAQFIDYVGIPAHRLVVVTHSMGGLVMRHILNHANPQALYYNPTYQKVSEATKYAITIQAPHTGSPAADAMYLEANYLGDVVAGVGKLLNIREGDRRTESMRQLFMRRWVADGSMNDEARTVPLFTIGGRTTAPEAAGASPAMSEDGLLDQIWQALCLKSGGANLLGALCGFDIDETPGDGFVTLNSAHGISPTSFRAPGIPLKGAHTKWLTVDHNHHQGRYDARIARIEDHLSGVVQYDTLGFYIGWLGHNLPGSAQRRDGSTR